MEHSVEELLTMMDEMNVCVIVDLDGMENKEMLITHIERFKAKAPDRFYHMGGIDWSKWEEKGSKFGDWAAKQVEEQVKLGASGIKIWKNLGLHIKDPQGNLVKVDDPRLDPIFETAASLKIPVYMHISDPVAFFDPVDQFNERIDDLGEHPEWSFFPTLFFSYRAFNRIRHKKTQFIGCHVASYAENLTWVSSLLDECPNLCVDISERIGELGRQPYTTRKFFIQYADRIIFGIDRLPDKVWYQIYARFLETDDEYFNYDPTYPPRQGRWFIYGIYLPDEVLGKVYYKNLSRILRINKQ